jgi:ATP-dependent Clp protease adaptor protein ClpS
MRSTGVFLLPFPLKMNKNRQKDVKSFGNRQKMRNFADTMPKEQSQIRERERVVIKEPRRYKVIIYNDDFTTMEFVVMILMQVFLKSEEDANALMLQVHHSDKAVVGIYTYDIAVSKARKATNMAREQGFPLRLTVEPEDKE